MLIDENTYNIINCSKNVICNFCTKVELIQMTILKKGVNVKENGESLIDLMPLHRFVRNW